MFKLVLNSPRKSCEIDPLPTDLLNRTLPAILLLLTYAVNASITTGVFLYNLKEALVKPLLKRANLDLIDKNYYSDLNLQFTGKLIERAVVQHLIDHIGKHNLLESLQMAYLANYCTEPALLKAQPDILRVMDNQQVMCLVLLNLSATIDSTDHGILLSRLEAWFDITGTALNWMKSYLTDCTQCVVVGVMNTDGSRSSPVPLCYGVPQRSALRLILFTLYTTSLDISITPTTSSSIFMQITSCFTSLLGQMFQVSWECNQGWLGYNRHVS